MELLDDFQRLWDASESPPNVVDFLNARGELDAEQYLAVVRLDQQRRWRCDDPLRVEDYLDRLAPPNGNDIDWKFQLAVGEFEARRETERPASIEELSDRFPYLSDRLRDALSTYDTGAGQTLNAEEVARQECLDTITSRIELSLRKLGRYRLVRLLGEGAFGRVYLAYDEQLERQVAIKVPTAERFQRPEDAETYLAEARTVAALDHPHIVTVHDVGRAPDGSPYVVSQYIEGGTLADRIKRSRPTPDESARILSAIAGALDYAHRRRLIHRDVKPANILIEQRGGDAFLTDFGLAIREEDVFKNPALAGTPVYMSPEQARGEGHRLDGRSDIFSLGVVLYELLTGRKPFRGSTANEIFHQIISLDPPSPRQVDENVPAELERICHKALAKQASDRYADAAAMADDLANWNTALDTTAAARTIVPKGLRSFDADDADFFIDLLPGPRSRFGLPESLQFWKTRIEQQDAEQTFACGLIYGPSGCGKSSLVKAGLLPRLANGIKTVYLEATPEETELRLMRGIRKQHPELPENLTLVEALANLRRRSGGKTVLVLDQFEQWLHARGDYAATELVAALRQCDGGRLQAIALVRDDFAMAAARFMDAMDIPIVQGHNFATVDLFDIDHARKVLARFGEAFDKLPLQADQWSDQQRAFVDQAAEALAVDGKVVSVRLSLFAEMVKAKPWTPEALKAVGGAEGVGVNFLEETFSSREANPAHRLHQEAARQVLRALLPEVGAEIKGHMRSHDELLIASGYQNRSRDFATLLRILDGELRLITPTDPMGADSVSRDAADAQYYQLTHDYLVPSLRRWLTAKQRETRRGRAELLLEERAALWNAKPETRFLPSLAEWARIATLTDRKRWTAAQQTLMQRAARVHGLRITMALAASVLVLVGGLWTKSHIGEGQARATAGGLVAALLSAETRDVPKLVTELAPYRQWADPELQTALDSPDTKTQLHARVALLPVDPSQVQPLQNALLDATPENVLVLRDALQSHGVRSAESYWSILESTDETNQRRLAAGAALAKFAPDDQRWTMVARSVSELLVNENPLRLPTWIDAYRSVRTRLIPELGIIFRDQSEKVTKTQRELVTSILGIYAADNLDPLAALILDADPKQFTALYDEFTAYGNDAKARMIDVITGEPKRELFWDQAQLPSIQKHPVSASDQALIKASEGMLADQFAFVQTIRRSDFESLNERLARSGYRPTRIRPAWIRDALNIAAVWHRDGQRSALQFDLNEDALTEIDKKHRNNGLAPCDIAGYIDRSVSPPVQRFVATWGAASQTNHDHQFYLGESKSANERNDRFQTSYHLFRGVEGDLVFSGVRAPTKETKNGEVTVYSPDELETLVKLDQVPYQSIVFDQALATIDADLLPQMIKTHSEHLESNPADWFRRLQRAKAYLLTHDADAAIADLDAILVDHPNCVPAIRERIIGQLVRGDRQVAAVETQRLQALPIGDWERDLFSQLASGKPDVAALLERKPETKIDLLRLIDAEQHSFDVQNSGGSTWTKTEDTLVSPAGVAKLNVPVIPEEAYRLRLLVTPLEPAEGKTVGPFILGLIRENKRFFVELNAWGKTYIQLQDEEQVLSPNPVNFQPEAIYSLDIDVGDKRIFVQVDGETVLEWEGETSDLFTKPFWETDRFCLTFCAYETNYRILNATLELPAGSSCELLDQDIRLANRLDEVERRLSMFENPNFEPAMEKLRRLRFGDRRTGLTIGWMDDAAREGEWVKPSSPAEHLVDAYRLAESDFIPVAIDVASVTDKTLATSVWQRRTIPREVTNKLARQKANASAALARLGDRDKLFAGLRVTDDPESLTQFVHRCREQGLTPSELWDCVGAVERARHVLEGEPRKIEDRVLFGLILALGEFQLTEIPGSIRDDLITKLGNWFANDPSSAIHGATGWLLRHWDEEQLVAQIEETEVPYAAGREWFRLVIPIEDQTFVQTYIVFEPGEYEIGSPPEEVNRSSDETRHKVRLTRTFAVLDREVTVGEFIRSRITSLGISEYRPSQEHVMSSLSWYDSVRFCRWLTTQSGLPENEQCYFDPQALDTAQYPPDPSDLAGGAPQNWPFDFSRRGFRLPTEAEWEVAARSGVRSAYGFGDDVGLLANYAWFQENSGRQTHAPRQLRPNFRGLFDMHGNVYDWCHDWYGNYNTATAVTDPFGAQKGSYRVVRGGSWYNVAAICRTASRGASTPPYRSTSNGLRLALSPSGEEREE